MSAPAPSDRLLLYATPEHECSYVPRRDAVTLFADPEYPKDPWLQGLLAMQGFRRSGPHLYKPRCPGCSACVAVRVPVAQFRPNRSQRRSWSRNQDLQIRTRAKVFSGEHYALYERYLIERHAGGGMDDPTPEKYRDFLLCDWADTQLVEFRADGVLVAVAVCDRVPNALSAVYTFFDPRQSSRGVGVFAVLWQIQAARRARLEWLYLGYFIEGCRKMEYKGSYLPQERYVDDEWRWVSGD